MGMTTDGLSYWQAESEEGEACHHRLRRDGPWRTLNASNGFRWPGGWLSAVPTHCCTRQ